MPKKIIHTSGAVEMVYDNDEKTSLKEFEKIKKAGKKKHTEFSQDEINRLVVALARKADLI